MARRRTVIVFLTFLSAACAFELVMGLWERVVYPRLLSKYEVTGRVTIDGEPATGGLVEFKVEGDYPAFLTRFHMDTAFIDAAGRYSVGLPAGKAKVRVRSGPGQDPDLRSGTNKKPSERYRSFTTSGLSCVVKGEDPAVVRAEGRAQVHDIILEGR